MSFLGAILDVLAPPLCCLCRRPPAVLPWLCAGCARQLEVLTAPRCLRCGAPRPLPTPVCALCPDWPPRLGPVRSAAFHRGVARDLLHALRRGRLETARPLGALVAAAARDLPLPEGTVLVPVPVHPRERRRLGLHPAVEIARVAARHLKLPVLGRALRRVRYEPAGEMRSPAGRRRALRGAFRATERVRGRSVLLVDGALIAGVTLGACVRALGRKGVAQVHAVTATRWFRP